MTRSPAVVDLRSDTVTSPTPEMRAVMADAEVGDDGFGEDPTVNRLESLAAALLGMEAALLTPSGTMANQLALRVLGRPGTQVLCGTTAHVFGYEHGAAGVNASVQLRPLPDHTGMLDPVDVAWHAAAVADHLPPVSAVFVENTHMASGGRPSGAAQCARVLAATAQHGLLVHCDGARIWNAAIALGCSPADLVAGCDTAMFCLSKGLAAPVGSLLCGRADVIGAARDERRRMGGRMRQAGVLAAAGIVGLETMVERLADDHERAQRLGLALAERFDGSVDPSAVRTNIVTVARRALPDDAIERLRGLGVLVGTIDPDTIRCVTHKDVDDAGIARAIAAFDVLAGR